jgi:hypothetical protein
MGETLAHALAASGADGAAPPAVRDLLRAAQEVGAARNLLLLTEAARLQAVLARCGIPSVALKGAALVAAHYASPGARHVSDLDLLVPADRAAEAAATLAGEGPWQLPLLDHRGQVAPAPLHLPPFDTAGGVACELHHQVPGYAGPEMATRVLATARAVAAPGGGALWIPAPGACAAIACVHALVAHRAEARYLPRLVADLEALEATGALDWAAARVAAGTGAPAVDRGRELLARAREGAVEAVFPGRIPSLAHALAPLLRNALSDPRSLVPTRRFMARRYRVPERSARLLLYYLARPVLALGERLRW